MEKKSNQGTCENMCPRNEIIQREKEGLLHPFEVKNETLGDRRPKAEPSQVVKEFRRPAAGRADPKSCDLRPAPVLLKTVNYLIDKIVPKQHCPWIAIYDYVFDRLRAVRQDIIVQRLEIDAVTILEKNIRFFLYSAFRLCEEDISIYDPQINHQHAQECMKWLLGLYRENSGTTFENRALFESVYLLYNLGDSAAIMHSISLPVHIRKCMQNSLDVCMAFISRNYLRTIRLSRRLSLLEQLAVNRHIKYIQRDALSVMCTAYNNRSLQYPISRLVSILDFKSTQDAMNECNICALSTTDTGVKFIKGSFKYPEKTKTYKWYFTEDLLKGRDISDLLHGNITHHLQGLSIR